MTEEVEEDFASQNLLENLIELISSTDEKVKKKKYHLVEATWKYRNEVGNLTEMIPKLRELEGTFNGGEKIKAEFMEFRSSFEKRCVELKEKLEKLDVILVEVGAEEEKAKGFAAEAQNLDKENLSTREGKTKYFSLKQEVGEWYDAIRLKFKEGKKLKMSLVSKANVEDVSQSLNAWKKASEVAREYGRKLTQMKRETENKEREMRKEMRTIEANNFDLKQQNSTLDEEIEKLREKIMEAEREILQNEASHEEIADDLRDKIRELQQGLCTEKQVKFEMDIECSKMKLELEDILSREQYSKKKIETLQARGLELESEVDSLREKVFEDKRAREDAEKLLHEIQGELREFHEDDDEATVSRDTKDDLKHVSTLVQTLKRKLEEDKGAIESLVSEIRGERDRNKENVDEIENLLSKVQVEEKGREEQGKLIETIRGLLDENEKLAKDLESQNKVLSDDITEERQRVTELRERVSELQDSITEEKRAKFELEMETSSIKDKLQEFESREELYKERIEMSQTRNKDLEREIDGLREMLDQNKQLAEDLKLKTKTVSEQVSEERQRVMELQERVSEFEENTSEEKRKNFQLEMETRQTKEKLHYAETREDRCQRNIETLQKRNQELENDLASLKENLSTGERTKEDAKRLLLTIQEELRELDDEDGDTGDNDDLKRLNNLVLKLKKKLEESKGFIENLESEISGERDRNKENVDEIEKLLSKVEVEERTREEQAKLIDTIRGLLDENEKLAADLESQNRTLNDDIVEERKRVIELRERVGQLQQDISDEKQTNFEMEMTVSKLQYRIEDEESKNEMSLKKIELLEKEMQTLLDTIKGKVDLIEDLRGQMYEYEHIKEKLKAERRRNEDNSESIVELQNRMVLKETVLEQREEEARRMAIELKNAKEKLGSVEKELEWIRENNDLLSGVLKEKDRNLQEKEDKLIQALANLDSEKSIRDEYSLKCKMLEKKVFLTESESNEITKVAEMAEVELRTEREKLVESDNEVMKLRGEIEEERRKNMDNQAIIEELEGQLSEADALNQYNQGVKSSSIENIMEAEKQNEQLLRIIEDLNEKVNDKEIGFEELVTGYAMEEQKLRDEMLSLRGQLNLANTDCRTKSEIIKYLKNENERMRNVMRIKESVFGGFDEDEGVTEVAMKEVEYLEEELEQRLKSSENFPGTPYHESHDRALLGRDEDVQELLQILDGEKERNAIYEEMINRLEEMVKLQAKIKDADETKSGETEEEKNSCRALNAKKEEYVSRKQQYAQDELAKLEKLVDDLRARLRAEQRNVRDRDTLIRTLHEASKRDLARNEELSTQLQSVQQKALQQLHHSEEMSKKFEDGQALVRELQMEAEKERLRASTIEAMMSSAKSKTTEKKGVVQDLKRRVEEYQKTVNDIKSKVDKINRHLHCMSPSGHESVRMVSPDVNVKRINERLASHSSFIRELKASVSAVEETSKSLRTEMKNQIDKNNKQDERLDDLLKRSTDYDKLVEETKNELEEIRKRYNELSGDLGPEDDFDGADARAESPTKLVRSMPEHELSKQLSSFEELLETIFSEEARRIEQLQDKLDDVFKKNVEFSAILYEIRENLEEERVKRGPWEAERQELRNSLLKSEMRIEHLQTTLEKEENTRENMQKKIADLEEQLREKERTIASLQMEIREAERSIHRLQKELAEEKERNFDLQERVIKLMQQNLHDSREKLTEIQEQAEEEVRKTTPVSALEKSEKETRIRELEDEMEKQGIALSELKAHLEKEQTCVFELSESLETERNQCIVKDGVIEEIRKLLDKEREGSEDLRKLLDEAEDRTLRLSEALTKEQVKGMEREDAIKHLNEKISEEQSRLVETRDALEEEIQLTNQLKERLSFEQLMKSEFERELDKVKARFSEEQYKKQSIHDELQREKNVTYETEHQLREQQGDTEQKNKMIEELKTDLETERKCYKILSERLQSEQKRIVELEMQLRETEAVISSDKDALENLRESYLRGEETHFDLLEKLEKAEKLNKEKDDEINSLINELATEKVRIDELLTTLDDERVVRTKLEERGKELEDVITRDELLFQELRTKIDSEVVKNRELVEDFDRERAKGSLYEDKIGELETQIIQDGELFEELKRTIEIEREQSRRLDEMLHEERRETVRRNTVLTELERELLSERKSKDELTGYLETERQNNLDLHEELRLVREHDNERIEIERKLSEENTIELEEKGTIEARKVRELESMLETEQFRVFEYEKAKHDAQKELEQKDYWLEQLANELTKDGEDSESSTDEDDARGTDEKDAAQKQDQPISGNSQLDELVGKIIAGRNARRNVKFKARERKRRIVEKEKILLDVSTQREEQKAQLMEYETKLKTFVDDLDSEKNRTHSYEAMLVEQEKRNQSLNELVESLEKKVADGFKRLHAATQQYENQMRENKTQREENYKMKEECEKREDKIQRLEKELENYKILCQEKDYISNETLEQVEELRKQLGDLERDVLNRKVHEEAERGASLVEVVPAGKDRKEAVKGLRNEVENVRKVIHNNLSELESLRFQLREKEEGTQSQALKSMQKRAERAEWQLTKLQLTYHLLLNDVEMKKCLVEEATNEASRLRVLLAEKEVAIQDLRENAKTSLKEREKVIAEIEEKAITYLREKESIISEMKKKAETPTKKSIQTDENELQMLRVALKRNEKQIQELHNEYKSKLARRDGELREVQISLEIMRTIYQGLKAEKEREDAVKNAEKVRKGKEDLYTAIGMIRDLQQQMFDLQKELFEEKQLAQSLSESNRGAKLPNETEKSYLKRRSSLRSVLSFQIEEKEKKIRRLKILLNSIETRYEKELLEFDEKRASSDKETDGGRFSSLLVQDMLSKTQDTVVEHAEPSTQTLTRADVVDTTQQESGTDDSVDGTLVTIQRDDSTDQEGNKPLIESEKKSLLSKGRILMILLVAAIVGFLPFVVSPPVAGSLLAFLVIPLIFLVSAYQSQGMTKDTALLKSELLAKERAYLEKVEEMRVRIDGDSSLIDALKKQLEDEIAEKEAKRKEVDEIMTAKANASDPKKDSEDFEARMQREIEKTKLLEAEKRKNGFEEYRALKEEIDRMKGQREAEMNERKARFEELEKLGVVPEEKRDCGIKRINIPPSAVPICFAISVVLCQVMGHHYSAPYVILASLMIFAVNAWYSKKKVAKMLTNERQIMEEQREEIDEMTELLDRQFDVVKSQKNAIEMLMKEIEKEQQERKEKRNTLAKLIWQLQELEGMQNLLAKESQTMFGASGLELAVRTKAEEKALERARFYNNMITTLQGLNDDEEDDDALADDLCEAAQELADYAEDQLEEQKRREIEEEKRRLPRRKKSAFPWKTISLATVNTGALAASLALQSYIVAALVALQAIIYGLQRRDGSISWDPRSEEVDNLRVKLRRESARSRSLKAETEKLKKLLETEKTYKMSDEFALEIKEKRRTKRSRMQSSN